MSVCAVLTASDHPRIRGEHASAFVSPPTDCGSSPHTRGAPRRRAGWMRGPGIIPAYAGSTSRVLRLRRRWRDHPRIRGEHRRVTQKQLAEVGSSPHTRGARQRILDELGAKRIIPAYAGSTFDRGLRPLEPQDHPRIRGEHPLTRRSGRGLPGSSPHTRGAPVRRGGGAMSTGDHPRIRGEHRIHVDEEDLAAGSSPHTRGALAGPGRRRGARADHPRIRGEHRWTRPAAPRNGGSSPHTRGARRRRGPVRCRRGIIPAYAGSTSTPLQQG